MANFRLPKVFSLLLFLGFFVLSFGFLINNCQAQEINIIVNKKNPLPASFKPSNLRYTSNGKGLHQEAYLAFQKMARIAKKDNLSLKIISAYRSYNNQISVYNSWVKKDGQAKADTYSARPGYSEHQTGLALDLGNVDGSCDLKPCFANTPAGRWLTKNAYKYGFIIRYPRDKAHITGYKYEPWHFRYVGVSLAKKIKERNQTLEEYFGLPPAPSY